MERKKNILISVIFCTFLVTVSLASLLLPNRTFSELENRNLQPTPRLNEASVASGRFMEDAEAYTSDHIALRDQWVSIHALTEKLLGKQVIGGVYLAEDNSLINRIQEPELEVLEEQVNDLNYFAGNITVPVYLGLIPSAASVWRDKLPDGAPTADEDAWIEYLYQNIQMTCIDMAQAMHSHADESIYYRTDHHWTSLGAFYGANTILDALELPELNLSEYAPEIVTENFCGTTWSMACAWWTEPDSIERYVPEVGVEVTSNFTGTNAAGRLYVPERLKGKNKYAYFLGGNQPLCVIRSESNGPRLLVIRDSYSDALAPFLSQRFSEVHLFDLRYNRSNLQDYIGDNEIDVVLLLYSFRGFLDETQFFLLTR